MSWTRYFLHDFWTAREFNALEDKLKRQRDLERKRRSRQTEERATLEARIAELEDDLGRVALLAPALAEASIAKGLVTQDELVAVMRKVDLLDGVADGKLDPQAQLGARGASDPGASP